MHSDVCAIALWLGWPRPRRANGVHEMRLAQIFTMSLLVLGLPAKAAPHADAAMVTIRLWSTTTYAKVLVDRRPTQQVGKGDLVLVESTLRNAAPQFRRPRGAVVGRDTVSFRVRSPRSADMTLEMDLPGGVLRAAGPSSLRPHTEIRGDRWWRAIQECPRWASRLPSVPTVTAD